jgi:hypothetical protein
MTSNESTPPQQVALPRPSSSWYPPARLGRRTYFPLGLALLLGALALYLAGADLPGLTALRREPDYALFTGLLMAAYLLAQLMMPVLRAGGGVPHRLVIRAHKLLGALGPLFIVIHAGHLGYGYLGALSGVFLLSMALGLMNHETMGLKGRVPALLWMVAHVALSVALVTLAAVHAYVALAYE